jgi:formate transporter
MFSTVQAPEPQSFDALLPAQMAARAELTGCKKARMRTLDVFVLAVLAGAFISLGAVFSTSVLAGASPALPFGVSRLLAGLAFSLGLILVIVGGAELFTGNALIVMGWANGRVSTLMLLKNWLVVYFGNFVGAVATAALVFLSGQYTFGQGTVGLAALATASSKTSLGFGQAVALGILCNTLVCLAVWLTFSARSTTDRILAIVPPITAFVAAGFEHSIANMYFLSIGLLIRFASPAAFWDSIARTPGDYGQLTWETALMGNLLPVTLGNMIGGAVLVGAVYWFVYLRSAPNEQGAEESTRSKALGGASSR